MENLTNKHWWKCAITRAVKTICQTAIAIIGTGQTGVLEINWVNVLSISATAGILSILTSIIAGIPEADTIETLDESVMEDACMKEAD